MTDSQRPTWDSFFKDRAENRASKTLASFDSLAPRLRYEVFLGPERNNFVDSEPSFDTLAQAFDWAHVAALGDSWRVRTVSSGALVFNSEWRLWNSRWL